MESRITNKLDELKKDGLFRSLKEPSGLDFSSNDYLGLAEDPRLKESFVNAIDRMGVGSTGSRLLRGERHSFSHAEKVFADWKQTEASLYFATGYQANVGILQALLQKNDIVFSDELNHASIIDGIRLGKAQKRVYSHIDLESLESFLNSEKCSGARFVVTESLFSMDGDQAPLDEIAELCRRYRAHLIIDEAHAVGLFGKTGSGLIEDYGIKDAVFLSINTAGKAMGVAGAFAAGSRLSVEYLINCCRSFIFSTAPFPAAAEVILESMSIIQNEPARRERLFEICREFSRFAGASGVRTPEFASHIVPIIVGKSADAVTVADRMQGHGFDVRAIRPPTVSEGTARLRVSLNTKLETGDLERFAKCLADSLREI